MTLQSSLLTLPNHGRVGAFASALLLCLALAAKAPAAEPVTRDIQKIRVRGEEIFLIKNHKPYFWLGCYPEIVDNFRGPKTIEIGEEISYGGGVVRVGLIRYVKHPEWTSSDEIKYGRHAGDCAFEMVRKSKGFNQRIRQHRTDCLIMTDESVLPPDGKCDTTWLIIPECREFIEEPAEEQQAEPQTEQTDPVPEPASQP
ncbi:hypothetical protein EPN96_02605 [bacterium]|nr:MAG: hypothetical protein EPN96_02605 [bacterium]